MSCWKKYTCIALKNVDKGMAVKAIQELGFGFDGSVKSVATSYFGGRESNKATCDGCLMKDNNRLQIGITFAGDDNALEVQGDFWNTGIDQKSLIQQLTDHYLKLQTIRQCELNGYTVDKVEETVDGTIEIEAYACA